MDRLLSMAIHLLPKLRLMMLSRRLSSFAIKIHNIHRLCCPFRIIVLKKIGDKWQGY